MSDKELIENIEDAYRRVRKIGPDAIYETELREVLRAAVPDAATEELERIKPLFENLSREYPNECNKRVKAEAERDAALAVLERVRAIAERHGMKPWTEEIFAALDVVEPCGAVAQALRTALDGGGSDE